MQTPRKSPPCPQCHTDQTALIQYGMPSFSDEETMAEKDQGIIEFGGCMIGDDAPRYRCHQCNHAWGNDGPRLGIVNVIPALDADYRATTFRVFADPARQLLNPIDIRIGEYDIELSLFLELHRVSEWAFITAYNPQSIPLSPTENEALHNALCRDTQAFLTLNGSGIPGTPGWEPEASLLVAGIPLASAEALGRKYGQAAIVVGTFGGAAELSYL